MMQYNCLKHGISNVPMCGHPACPKCEAEREVHLTPGQERAMHDALMASVKVVGESVGPEQRQAEEAVLRAAVAYRKLTRVGEPGGAAACGVLNDAIDAYLATRQPQSMRPEEVGSGVRFRFDMTGTPSEGDERVFVTMMRAKSSDPMTTYVRGYLLEGGTLFYDFAPEDRIIPIVEKD